MTMPPGVIQSVILKACGRERPNSLSALIKLNAEKYSLDAKLVACIIYQESGGDEEAYRCEDHFFDAHYAAYLTTPPKKNIKDLVGYVPRVTPTLRSELRARSTSWGVMQTLGETARMMGYDGRWLPACRKNEINVDLGCKYLRHLFSKAAKIPEERKLFQVLNWWNGSEDYPPLIFEHLQKEKWRAILQ